MNIVNVRSACSVAFLFALLASPCAMAVDFPVSGSIAVGTTAIPIPDGAAGFASYGFDPETGRLASGKFTFPR